MDLKIIDALDGQKLNYIFLSRLGILLLGFSGWRERGALGTTLLEGVCLFSRGAPSKHYFCLFRKV